METHAAFADESHWNTGRFRAVGMLSASIAELPRLEERCRIILRKHSVSELAWKDLDDNRALSAAQELSRLAVDAAREGLLRVDVVIWDTHDRRHNIRRRDDVANLLRMYLYLLANVLRERWPEAVWAIHPDDHNQLHWQGLQDLLGRRASDVELCQDLFTGGRPQVLLKEFFRIHKLEPVTSGARPLIQLGDLFAGLAICSRLKFDEFKRWQTEQAGPGLFDIRVEPIALSNSERVRFQLLDGFNSLCKSHRLQVSLDTHKGLRTMNPEKPINFWPYEPQHEADKAPVREVTQ